MTTKYIPSNTSRNENQLTLSTTGVVENKITNTNGTGNTGNTGWGTPIPLDVDPLPKPKELRKEMLPKAFRQFIIEKSYSVDDTAPDYLAVALVVMSASIIGSNAEIKPKKHDSWSIACTLWAFLIGKASDKKTPALLLRYLPSKK
ncbi:hypothetical protein [Vibrio porteresiae]|uniref:Uncharacterized protein n=1 Tax=Vibrio porteresiae DSM 19223 TaxID=1123496 RepID=A0ABZ0QER2_9VIBR|nr:hypothetical protein [Vibrio porteresiae]WPC74952.1 hypothetical protein R8Z52_07075 [Vibrio porteresiae DSM 19223]